MGLKETSIASVLGSEKQARSGVSRSRDGGKRYKNIACPDASKFALKLD